MSEKSPPAEPLTDADLAGVWRTPHRIAEIFLGRWRAIADYIWKTPAPVRLLALQLVIGVLAALAYGLVWDAERPWSIAALYGGSVLLCVPALHVFGCYFGGARRATQDLAMALTLSTTAALFTFGFAPVLWFLKATMHSGTDGIAVPVLSVTLLAAAFVAGLGQLARTVGRGPVSASQSLLVGCWGLLVAAICWRMAQVLELTP
jgi:FtsH-binding integral membrane protein